jgi:hypothetical protein
MIDFLGELCACVKRVDAHAKTMIALLPQDLGQVDELAALPHLDTVGGHLFWQLLREDVEIIEKWGQLLVDVTRQHGKRSQLWLQNFNLNEDSEQYLEVAFAQLLHVEPDEVGAYYYWRNNENPARVWQTTRTLLRRIPRRQLYWQASGTNAKGEI